MKMSEMTDYYERLIKGKFPYLRTVQFSPSVDMHKLMRLYAVTAENSYINIEKLVNFLHDLGFERVRAESVHYSTSSTATDNHKITEIALFVSIDLWPPEQIGYDLKGD